MFLKQKFDFTHKPEMLLGQLPEFIAIYDVLCPKSGFVHTHVRNCAINRGFARHHVEVCSKVWNFVPK